MGILKMVFCRHKDLEFLGNIHGDLICQCGFKRSAWRCKRCGRLFFKPHLVEGSKKSYNDYLNERFWQKIIAVDFDGTLCESCYPDIGKPRKRIIRRLLKEQRNGAKIILWTCRCGKPLEEAVRWCKQQGITFDCINESLPEQIAQWDTEARKIFAHEYWDDRAVRC